MRAKYEELIHNPAKVDALLLMGAAKARDIAPPFIKELRHAVGLRALASVGTVKASTQQARSASPSFKQYREQDGQFYFKLVDPQGKVLLQSTGFTSPKDAGAAIARLQQNTQIAISELDSQLALGQDVSMDLVLAAIERLVADIAEKAQAKG
jgi:tryptophanyl-tRNA synthetase